jgi:hypothetical protein
MQEPGELPARYACLLRYPEAGGEAKNAALRLTSNPAPILIILVLICSGDAVGAVIVIYRLSLPCLQDLWLQAYRLTQFRVTSASIPFKPIPFDWGLT